MVDAGLLTREEAATHRLRNVLTNVLGGGAPLSDVDVHRIQLAHGDTMLLCTDGLHGVASDEEIRAILSDASSAEEACRSLLEIAIGRGAPDNVTAAVARYAPA